MERGREPLELSHMPWCLLNCIISNSKPDVHSNIRNFIYRSQHGPSVVCQRTKSWKIPKKTAKWKKQQLHYIELVLLCICRYRVLYQTYQEHRVYHLIYLALYTGDPLDQYIPVHTAYIILYPAILQTLAYSPLIQLFNLFNWDVYCLTYQSVRWAEQWPIHPKVKSEP